ncbi:site-2 protease family protein [Candidatus Falkowbacteria bacterium]|nr:site-2 protease family protein [Candidatus Falkowbacteria bacterium]
MIILTIIVFFAILGLLVLVHELGHFITARRAGIKVEEFGLGLPPRAIGFYKNEEGKWKRVGIKSKEASSTIWSLNWIPLGGFVKIKGEDGGNANDPESFGSKSILTRIIVISAGVSMNILLAFVIFTIGLTIGLPQVLEEDGLPAFAKVRNVETRVVDILPDSPADLAGLELMDIVVRVDGEVLGGISDYQAYFDGKTGETVSLEIKRGSETINTEVTPIILAETGRGAMGVGLIQTGIVSYPFYVSWWYGLAQTYELIIGILFGFYLIIKSLVVENKLIGDVYGPIGIATLVGDAVQLGFLYVIQFTAALSVIIAVINYLPFPALDGGRALFLLIEGIRKKPVNPKIESAMHNAGFALLMLLVLVVTFRDIARISSGFSGLVEKISGFF